MTHAEVYQMVKVEMIKTGEDVRAQSAVSLYRPQQIVWPWKQRELVVVLPLPAAGRYCSQRRRCCPHRGWSVMP